MENWRKYKKSLLVELPLTDPDIAFMAGATDNQDALKRSKAVTDVYTGNIDPKFGTVVIELAKSSANLAAMLLDPTGQFAGYDFDTGKVTTSAEVLDQEVSLFKKKPSLAGAAGVALASLAMIPLIGGLGKLNKISKVSRSTRLRGRARTVLANAQEVSKELKAAGGTENIAKANKIDKTIETLKLPTGRRAGGYIRRVQSQINKSIMRGVSSGSIKVGDSRAFKVPGGERLELHRVDISIKVMPEKNLSTNRKIISSGEYGSDRLGTGRGYGGDIEIEILVHPKYINKDGTIDKLAFSDLNKELNKTGFHEMTHSRQAARQRKGSKADEDLAATDINRKEKNTSYLSYRLWADELSAHARDAARGTTILKVSKTGEDTLDLMAQRISSNYSSFGDLVRADVESHLKMIQYQVKYILKNLPCAALSASNVIDLEALGFYDSGNLSQKNQNIVNTYSKNKAIAANPKNCSKKLVERIIIEEIINVFKQYRHN